MRGRSASSFRGTPGQDGRGAIDARVAEPALGRSDQAAGDLGAAAAGELAAHPRGLAEGVGDGLAGDGRVEARGEERARLDLGGRDELRDGEDVGAARARRGRPTPRRCGSCPDRCRRRPAVVMRGTCRRAAYSARTLSSIFQRSSGFSGRRGHGLQQQRPHLRHARPQPHGHDVALAPALGGQRHLDGRQLLELAVLPARRARRRPGPRAARSSRRSGSAPARPRPRPARAAAARPRVPSSIPKGARQSAVIGGSTPGTAGTALSMPT